MSDLLNVGLFVIVLLESSTKIDTLFLNAALSYNSILCFFPPFDYTQPQSTENYFSEMLKMKSPTLILSHYYIQYGVGKIIPDFWFWAVILTWYLNGDL